LFGGDRFLTFYLFSVLGGLAGSKV
jgi:hypothetical protein